MGRLLLLRHGQANFAPEAYGGLTEIGRRQADALGAWLGAHEPVVELVLTGPQDRHRETAERAARAAAAAGATWPEPVVDAALDEYAAHALIAHGVPFVVARDPSLAELVPALTGGRPEPGGEKSANDVAGAGRRAFGRIFRAVTDAWIDGELEAPGLEPFDVFRRRVETGLADIVARGGRGATILAFTSGGAIGAAVGHAVGASDPHKVFGLSWVHVNAALTELLYGDGRLSLVRFNAAPHLDVPELRTAR